MAAAMGGAVILLLLVGHRSSVSAVSGQSAWFPASRRQPVKAPAQQSEPTPQGAAQQRARAERERAEHARAADMAEVNGAPAQRGPFCAPPPPPRMRK
ncbi:hypothetical protein OAO87_01380 [bacterium]|nr:hypothetical protein [bacterium]